MLVRPNRLMTKSSNNAITSPSMDADFTTGVLDSKITFSRASNATVTGSDGLIQYAPHNLLTYSEQFDNLTWVKTTTTVAANSFVAPSGNTTADALTASGANSTTLQTFTAIASPYTFSVYLYRKTGTGNIDITVDGTTRVTKTITAGWNRVETTLTPTAGSKTAGIRIVTNGDAVYVWGVQLEARSSASTYNPTTVKNLLGYSEAFDNAAWTKLRATVSANSVVAPNGTTTADSLLDTAVAGTHVAIQTITKAASAITYTASVYVKAGVRNQGELRVSDQAGNGVRNTFDLSSGTIGTPSTFGTGFTAGSSTITAVGNGWYRVSIIATTNSATTLGHEVYIANASANTSYTGDGSGFYVWGAQLSDSASVDTYVNNPVAAPSAAAYYGPRFDYDPVTLQPKGLLIEEQRTNLILQSEDFSSVSWSKNNSSVTTNTVTSPDGLLTGDKLISANGQSGSLTQTISKAASAITYTQTIYAKAGEFSWLQLAFFDGSTLGYRFWFNLATGVVGSSSAIGSGYTSPSSSITSVGNGWYRCTITATSSTQTSNITYVYATNGDSAFTLGNGTSGIYIWGAQLEAGAFATSYIPTVASQVTRSADVALIQGSNFSGFYNQPEGTLFVSAIPVGTIATNTRFAELSGGTSARVADLYISGAKGTMYNGTTAFTVANPSTVLNTTYNLAGAYKTADYAIAAGGIAPATASSTVVNTATTLYLGRFNDGSNVLNGTIKKLAYYSRRLTNAELQAITS